jgi:acyl transferase domain-containing protein
MFAPPTTPDAALLHQTQYTQTALFALEVALYRLVESFGITPSHLLGHSIGELAAAHIAGILSLPDACTLVTARAHLMQALPGNGAMVSLHATETQVQTSLTGMEDQVTIAAVNGPTSIVISGDHDTVLTIASQWEERGHKTRRLTVSHAFHSPHMDGMLHDFHQVAQTLTYHPPTIPLISTLTGTHARTDMATPDYWVRQVRQTVRFHDGLHTLAEEGITTYLELGPTPILTALAKDGLPDPANTLTTTTTMRPDHPEAYTFTAAVAQLYVTGTPVDWRPVFPGAHQTELPTYAFQREPYWLDAPVAAGNVAAAGLTGTDHPLLGAVLEPADGDGLLLTGRISLGTHPWLADHTIADTALLPASAFVEFVLQAGQFLGLERISELTLEQPLALPATGTVQIQVVAGGPDTSGRRPCPAGGGERVDPPRHRITRPRRLR